MSDPHVRAAAAHMAATKAAHMTTAASAAPRLGVGGKQTPGQQGGQNYHRLSLHNIILSADLFLPFRRKCRRKLELIRRHDDWKMVEPNCVATKFEFNDPAGMVASLQKKFVAEGRLR
jgi:hypothetical protein